MIRIKDFIFNENEIVYIWESDEEELYVQLKIDEDNPSNCKKLHNATFDDIEWNYDEKENTDLITIKDYIRDNWGELFNKDTTLKQMVERIILRYNLAEEDLKNESNNYKECIEEKYRLKEENEKLNSINKIHTDRIQELMRRLGKRTDRIDKALKDTEELYKMAKEQDSDNVNLIDRLEIILKTLEGE